MKGFYYVIRHSDDTGHEAIVDDSARRSKARAERLAADLNRTARYHGAAVTYRVLEPVKVSR